MKRRDLLVTPLALGGFAASAWAQGLGKGGPRIAMVSWRGETDVERGFRDAFLPSQGGKLAPGVQPRFEPHNAQQNRDRLATIREQLLAGPPDLIYAWGTSVALGLMGAIDAAHPVIGKTVPLVFAPVADPVGSRVVPNLREPGRWVSGVSHMPSAMLHWQAMGRYAPAKRVGVLYNPLESNSVANVREWQGLAKAQGFELIATPFEVVANLPSIGGVEALVQGLHKRGAQWLFMGPDTFLFSHIDRIAQAALALKLPTFAATESQIVSKAPVLMGLVAKFYQVGLFAGYKAQQLLAGPQARVPVETLARFSMVVRLSTAKAINVLPPLGLIDHAEFRP